MSNLPQHAWQLGIEKMTLQEALETAGAIEALCQSTVFSDRLQGSELLMATTFCDDASVRQTVLNAASFLIGTELFAQPQQEPDANQFKLVEPDEPGVWIRAIINGKLQGIQFSGEHTPPQVTHPDIQKNTLMAIGNMCVKGETEQTESGLTLLGILAVGSLVQPEARLAIGYIGREHADPQVAHSAIELLGGSLQRDSRLARIMMFKTTLERIEASAAGIHAIAERGDVDLTLRSTELLAGIRELFPAYDVSEQLERASRYVLMGLNSYAIESRPQAE